MPSGRDNRPESRKVRADQIKIGERIGPERGWIERRKIIFADTSWHFDCVEHLKAERQESDRSLGLVRVREVVSVKLEERPAEDLAAHEKKLAKLREKLDLFRQPVKELEFFPYKVRLAWRCKDERCPGHTAAVMDWGLGELGRREGPQKALQKMSDLSDVRRYDLRLFMGNMMRRRHVFGIVALWYPLLRDVRRYQDQQEMFTP